MATLECGTGEGEGDDEREPSVDLVIRVLYVLGFWLDDEPTPTVETYSRYFGPRLARLLARSRVLRGALQFTRSFMPWNLIIYSAFHILIVHPVDIYLSWDNKLYVLEDIYCILVVGLIFVTMVTFMFQKEKGRLLYHQHQLIYENNMVDDDIRKILARRQNMCTNVTKGFLMISLALALAIILGTGGYYLPNREFIFRCWYPYDKFASPAYEITVMYIAFGMISLLFVGNTFLSLAAMINIHEYSYFEILVYKLSNIYNISHDKILSRKKQVEATRMLAINNWRLVRCLLNPPVPVSNNIPGCVDLETHHNLADLSPRHWLVEEGGVVSETHLQSDATSNLQSTEPIRYDQLENKVVAEDEGEDNDAKIMEGNVSRNQGIPPMDVDKEMQLNLVVCVKLHQMALRITLSWQSFWEVHNISNYVANIVLFAATTVLVQTVDHLSMKEFVEIFVWLQVVGLCFSLNYSANQITSKAEAVSEALYFCDWLEASPSFKRLMLIMMTRAYCPLELKPTGLAPLSCRNFAEMANMAYKMLATTRTMVAKAPLAPYLT